MPNRTELTIRGNYALFWGSWPSNWSQSPFDLGGRTYNCVEQWMMAEKARLFGDKEAEASIMATSDPANQKRFGRAVMGYNDIKWAATRYAIVLQGTLEKYRQNNSYLTRLLATGDLIFVEASPYDRVWGIGMYDTNPDSGDPTKWKGENLLGKAITEAREIIRKELSL